MPTSASPSPAGSLRPLDVACTFEEPRGRGMSWNEIEARADHLGADEACLVERRDERPEMTTPIEPEREEAAGAHREHLR